MNLLKNKVIKDDTSGKKNYIAEQTKIFGDKVDNARLLSTRK